MSIQKHTPGPWIAGRRDAYEINITSPSRFIADIYNATAKVGNGYPSADEADANAALITAAPELLKAARQAAMSHMRYGMVMQSDVTALLEAIAKAEGGAA